MLRVVFFTLVLASCKDPMTPHSYCVKRQMAWEAAFPDLPETDAQRDRFIETCVAQSAEAIAHSMHCMEQEVTGKRDTKLEYLAFTKCEAQK